MAVKPGERVVVYATRKDGKWLARVVKLSTAQPKDAGSSAPDTAAQEYTCPMHPEVRSPTPGKCPKCGMTLQPMRKR